MAAFLRGWREGLNFSDRARRREFWLFNTINHLVLLVLAIPAIVEGVDPLESAHADMSLRASTGLMFASIYSVAVFVPLLAVSARRMHDIGKSGWWILLSLFPIGNLYFFFYALRAGERGTNAWGYDPKETDAPLFTAT